jgi:hypothetical protein
MTNSLELLRLADSLDRQGFYKLAQEAEQAAQQQELQENSSDVYGMAGNATELYSAFNYLQQLESIFVRPQIRQLFLAGKLNSIDAMINQFARLGDGNAVKLLQSMSKNKFIASRIKNLSAYLTSFEPGAFFTAEELILLKSGSSTIPQAIKMNGVLKNIGITEEVINANPGKFRNVLRLINNGQVDKAVEILKSIEGVTTTEIMQLRKNAPTLTKLIQEEANVLKFDKAATQKGNGVFTALKAMASEIPAVAKVIQVLEWGMSKGLPILGILAGAVEVIAYSNQLKSAPEEEKADIRMDIAQGVINIVGNACMLFPPAAPVGTIILGLNFAADLVQGQSKNWMAQAEGFENAEQMKQTKQIAEQDLSVISTNPEVTKIMDYIIKKKWMYLSDPIGYKTEVSQLLTPNGVLMEAGSLYGSDSNANFWKWSKNTNSPEYLELIQSITQLKQKLYRDARSNPNNFIRARNPGFTPPRAAKVKVKLKYA